VGKNELLDIVWMCWAWFWRRWSFARDVPHMPALPQCWMAVLLNCRRFPAFDLEVLHCTVHHRASLRRAMDEPKVFIAKNWRRIPAFGPSGASFATKCCGSATAAIVGIQAG
jgi:hypothetical protein